MAESSAKACHTCRRRRVKCDRTLPQCQKCAGAGVECLGYGRLILWNQGIASRGKMMGKSFGETKFSGSSSHDAVAIRPASSQTPAHTTSGFDFGQKHFGGISPAYALIDPLLQDLDQRSRHYIAHFASRFCQELVIYDIPGSNSFRSLLQGIGSYPALRNMIIATSAYDLFCRFPSGVRHPTSYRDALAAKHRALQSLRLTLENVETIDINSVLTAILLLIHFELIDSGKNAWKAHIAGAQMLVCQQKLLEGRSRSFTSVMTNATDVFLISECIV
jgi:hypothetical protein